MSTRLHRNRGIALDLQQLEAFQMVATTGSFTRAAESLGYSQSNVTYHVKNLETYLGLSLFKRERFTKNPELTASGHRVLQHAERILGLARDLLSKEGIESKPQEVLRHNAAGSSRVRG